MRWSLLTSVAALFVAACGGDDTPAEPITELIVVVDTDLAVPGEVDAITVGITGTDGVRQDVDVALARVALPATLVLYPAGQRLGPVRIEAIGKRGGAAVVWARASTSFLRGERRVVHLVLWRVCSGDDICTAEGTCTREGSCGPAGIAPEDLPPWTGSPPGIDGRVDGGMEDGGGPRDAGMEDVGCAAPTFACAAGVLRTLCSGVEVASTPCDLGCSSRDPTRCAAIVSSFVAPEHFARAAAALTLPAAIDTTACAGGMVSPQTRGGGDVCVMVATEISSSGTVRVTGSRPLVLLATGDVTIRGTIDVSADFDEAGAGGGAGGEEGAAGGGSRPGGALGAPEAGGGGGMCGAGGAAGSFEPGKAGSAPGGMAIDPTALPPLGGGSGGGGGGGSWGGAGGGAIAIAARGTIHVIGSIVAGGGAGEGGLNGIDGGGGAGGGSGGMIALEAVMVEVQGTAVIGAGGGGGGGGGVNYVAGDSGPGTNGREAAVARADRAPGGPGADGFGGPGGAGGGGAMIAGDQGGPPDNFTLEAPGGGGGGAGCIFVHDARGTPDVSLGYLTPRVSPALRQGVAMHD